MNFYRELESTLFFFGFQKCKKRGNINFLKLSKQDYLVMRISKKVEVADLIHAKFSFDSNPCDSEPFWEKSIKLGFSPESDNQLIKDFIKSFQGK